jgi:hypothetical protein
MCPIVEQPDEAGFFCIAFDKERRIDGYVPTQRSHAIEELGVEPRTALLLSNHWVFPKSLVP